MKIKICGVFRDEDIAYIQQAQPDYVGFVFAESRRQITLQKARYFSKKLNPHILKVGVFVDEEIDKIVDIVHEKIIDLVQLHGNENQEYIDSLKQQIDIPIIKAIKVKSRKDIDFKYSGVDYYLLDSQKGGSGQAFEWEWIKELTVPFFLAGGITLDNLDQAMQVNSYGIDVSSGVESHGIKDQKKINEMVRRVRNGNR